MQKERTLALFVCSRKGTRTRKEQGTRTLDHVLHRQALGGDLLVHLERRAVRAHEFDLCFVWLGRKFFWGGGGFSFPCLLLLFFSLLARRTRQRRHGMRPRARCVRKCSVRVRSYLGRHACCCAAACCAGREERRTLFHSLLLSLFQPRFASAFSRRLSCVCATLCVCCMGVCFGERDNDAGVVDVQRESL